MSSPSTSQSASALEPERSALQWEIIALEIIIELEKEKAKSAELKQLCTESIAACKQSKAEAEKAKFAHLETLHAQHACRNSSSRHPRRSGIKVAKKNVRFSNED